jgi:hypothetical protein
VAAKRSAGNDESAGCLVTYRHKEAIGAESLRFRAPRHAWPGKNRSVTVVSPRVDRRLVDAAETLDDPSGSYAENWRQVGVVAERLGLTRPGYDSIRRALRDHRHRRAEFERLVGPVVVDVLAGRISRWDAERWTRAQEAAQRFPRTEG